MCDHCAACESEGFVATGCRLCGKASYCSAECASDAWALHALECNVERAASLHVTMAVPYVYQDVLDAKHFEPADLQTPSYVQQHVNPSGLISSRVVGVDLVNSNRKTAVAEDKPVKYSIHINGERATATGTSKENCIAAKMPGSWGKLAAQRLPTVDKDARTYWMPLAAPVSLEPGEPVTISLVEEPSGRVVSTNTVQVPSQLETRTLSRKARAPVAFQLQEKRLSATHTVALVAQCPDATLRLAVDPSAHALLDVEYELGTGAEPVAWDQQRFTCSSSDVDQVTGLIMAMAQRIGNAASDGVPLEFETDYAIIHDHLERLHADPNTPSSAKVNAAINRAVQAQFEHIEGPFSYARDMSKIVKMKRAKNGDSLFKEFTRHLENAEIQVKGEGNWTESRMLARSAYNALSTMDGFSAAKYPELMRLVDRLQTLESKKFQVFKGRTQRRWEKGKQAKEQERQKLEALRGNKPGAQGADTYATPAVPAAGLDK